MIQAVIQNQTAAKTIGYFSVDDTSTCGGKAGLFPEKPTPAQLAKVTTLPAGQYRSLCVRSASKITALYVARNSDGALSFYASGSGTITLVLSALGGAGYNQTKVMTTADGPYSRDGLFTGSLVYGSLFGGTADGQFALLAKDDAGGTDGYVLTLAGSTPAQALKTAAAKLTSLYVARNSGGSLSFYASGSGSLTLTLTAQAGTAAYSETKTMTTADGPYSRDGLFTGSLTYGSLFGKVPNGSLLLVARDDAGGQESFAIVTTDTAPSTALKTQSTGGSSTSPGTGSGGATGTTGSGSTGSPRQAATGKVEYVSPSARPDVMDLEVYTVFEGGKWWFKVRFKQRGYLGGGEVRAIRVAGFDSWIDMDTCEAHRWPCGYPVVFICNQMSKPFHLDKLAGQDAKGHCSQRVFTS